MKNNNLSHSNRFFILRSDKTYEEVNGVKFKNRYELDLFKHYDKATGWKITEAKTGLKVYNGIPANFDSVIENNGGIDKFKKLIDDAVQKYGLTPRYTEPNIRKEKKQTDPDIIFTKCLYHKTKKYLLRFYNENGVELYKKKEDSKASSFTIYTICNKWAIPLGNNYDIDSIVQKLSDSTFSVHEWLVSAFDKQMTNAEQCADLGVAEYLDRLDEARKHNEPIKLMWEAERHKNNEEAAAKEKAFLCSKQTEYETIIQEAENGIRNRHSVRNRNIAIYKSRYDKHETTLFNALFKKYGIIVPLKTQGWINKALVEICYEKEYGFTYRYYKSSSASTVFMGYVIQLIEMIDKCAVA